MERKWRKIDPKKLCAYVAEHPDEFLEEIGEAFECSGEAIRITLKRHKITRKKMKKYKERNEALRAEFQRSIAKIPRAKLIYVDECGVDKEMSREYGRSLRSVPVYGEVCGRKFKRTNIIAGRCGSKVVAPGEYKGNTDHKLFEAWFSGALLKEAQSGSLIVLDNATFHRKKTLQNLAEHFGCSVLFLPPYSPDLNPIEKLWANLKKFLKHHLRFFHSLSAAICAFFHLG